MEPRDNDAFQRQSKSYYEDSIMKLESRVCPACGLKLSASTTTCPNDGTQLIEVPKAGTMLGGKYELVEEVGTGGMGVIFKARQPTSDKVFAIKMMHTHRLAEQGLLRFQKEAQAGLSLKHPNVIGTHDFGLTEQGQPYMVMDYVEGITLADLIEKGGPMSVDKSVKVASQICQGIKHAHEKGILHRDLKSSNVMLINPGSENPQAVVLDFGMAKILDPDQNASNSKQLTKTGEVFGSPMYMSPEQCMGKKLDQRSDIYSFGCVLFEMLTGNPPLLGDSIVETVFKQVNEAPPTLREGGHGKKFPPGLEALVARCLAKNADDRFQSMADIEKALKVWNKQTFFTTGKKAAEGGGGQAASLKSSMTSAPVVIGSIVCFVIVCIVAIFMAARSFFAPIETVKPVTQPEVLFEPEKQSPLLDASKQYAKVRIASDPHATHLYMNGNPFFSDNDMRGVADMHELEVLYIGGTGVTAAGLQYIEKLPLKRLSMDNSDIPPEAMNCIVKVKSLEELSIATSSISDDTVARLSELPNLRNLDISGCLLTNDGLFNLAKLKKLETLNMRGFLNRKAYFTESGLSALGQIKTLKELDLSSSNLSDDNIAGLVSIKNLEKLIIESNTKVTPAGLAKITSLHLKEIDISHNNLGDDAIKILTKIPTLSGWLINNTPATAAGLQLIAKHPVDELKLTGTRIGDDGMKPVATMTRLETLEVGPEHGGVLTDAGIKQLYSLRKLKRLVLHSREIGDAVKPIVENNSQLEHLDLSSSKATDAILDVVARLSHLKELNLARTNVTANGVLKLAALKKLELLSLVDTPAGRSDVDRTLGKLMPKCKITISRR
jgi:serine/threonine protein kinase/Leucine-rich repeat (LRR) protein